MSAYKLLIFTALPLTLTAGWHEKRAEGWAWHEDRNLTKEEDQESLPQKKVQTANEQIEEIRKNLEELKTKAILEPTKENVIAYIREQNKWVSQSHEFAKAWTETILRHPELDFSLEGMPVSQYGQKYYKNKKSHEIASLIESMSKDHALLFIYEGKNPATSEVAKAVELFSKRYDWLVTPVSVDGVTCEELPESIVRKDNKEKFDLPIYPALAVVCPETNDVTPIAFGFFSVDMIKNNIYLLFSDKR